MVLRLCELKLLFFDNILFGFSCLYRDIRRTR